MYRQSSQQNESNQDDTWSFKMFGTAAACLVPVSTQQVRGLRAKAEYVAPTPVLQLQTNEAPHDPTKRENGRAECTVVDEASTLRRLLDNEGEHVPGNSKTSGEVTLDG